MLQNTSSAKFVTSC